MFSLLTSEAILNTSKFSSFMTDQEQVPAIIHVDQVQTLMNPASKQAVPPHVVNEAAPPDVQPPPAAQPGNYGLVV